MDYGSGALNRGVPRARGGGAPLKKEILARGPTMSPSKGKKGKNGLTKTASELI